MGKFFTLLNSLLLSGTVGVVSAQQLPANLEQLQQIREQGAASGNSSNAMQGFNPAQVGSSSQTLNGTSSTAQRGQYRQPARSGLLLPSEVSYSDVFPAQEPMENPPFAANLFIGGFESERGDGLSDDYVIAAGDKVAINMWGAVTYSDVLSVDNQGNIFIPSIGPVRLLNVPASQVNTIVTQRIKQVYTTDVNIYVNLLTATPVSVFVTGPVIRPGQYAGQSADSVLYFLKRAGGIDFNRGSFRTIDIVRNAEVVEQVDLYDFATAGNLPDIQFQDGDTILVHPISDTIVVQDGARNSFTFELDQADLNGKVLSQYAKPSPSVTHVSVAGHRGTESYSAYVTLSEFAELELLAGDKVIFVQDTQQRQFVVSIAGNTQGPSSFAVQHGTKLKELLRHVAVDRDLVDLKSIHLLRKSVAQQQKDIIEQALQRLERSVFTAPISSTGEGAIRVQEAQLVNDFIARAREIEPIGRVVVTDDGNVADLLLEPDDQIVIPNKTDLIHIGGEVLMPQSIIFNPAAKVEDYIAWSGGLTERANTDRIIIIRGNGVIDFYSGEQHYWLGASKKPQLHRGDQVIVLPRIDVKSLQTIKDITQIIYQIAVAANVAIN